MSGRLVLPIRNQSHELLDEDGLAAGVEVLLAIETTLVDQHIGVSDDSRHRGHDVVINLVQLAAFASGHEKSGPLFLLGSQNHA